MVVVWTVFPSNRDSFSEKVKIVLREIGNQLLLSQDDSTSLIKPVLEIEDFKYELSFDRSTGFKPGKLVDISKKVLLESGFSKGYIVEVLQCRDGEVAYSFKVSGDKEEDLIPCVGRELPLDCYQITINFTEKPEKKSSLFYVLILILLGVLLLYFIWKWILQKAVVEEKLESDDFSSFGSFQFYPDQNKLVKQSSEIGLSKKECELLAILVENLNQVVKRDELSKKVWEDNGVFVGRSLDTYISKLRKKLKEDSSVHLTNIHGVGYKLEIKENMEN